MAMFKKLKEYILNHHISRYYVLLIDLIASLLSTLLIYWGLNSIISLRVDSFNYPLMALCSLVASLISFLIMKTHRGIIRHTTMKEMWRVSIASFLKIGIMLALIFALRIDNLIGFKVRTILAASATDVAVTMFFLILIRIALTNFYAYISSSEKRSSERVVIYGEDSDSVSALSAISNVSHPDYKCLGFLVKGDKRNVKRICGLPVYNIDDQKSFNKFIYSNNVKGVIFPNHNQARREKNEIVKYAYEKKMNVYITSQISELTLDRTAPIREVKIEDLLGREEVDVNMKEIESFIKDKVVMVTGGAGSIGGELCRILSKFPIKSLLILDNAETPLHQMMLELDKSPLKSKIQYIIADVRIKERIDSIFAMYKPNIVFHAAAYKHVPIMESNPCEAVSVNVMGTKIVADTAVKYGVEKMIMISSDKAVNPANVMGASKRIAEIYVQSLSKAIIEKRVEGNTKFITTRFGNVLGSNGSVIPLFREQIEKGGPVTITDSRIIRYFMTIPEACRLVLEAATMGDGYEIFSFDMGEPVRIRDLAENMISLAGLRLGEDIEIKEIGLRPGEKLYEELLNNEENTIPTAHKKISIAKVRDYDYFEVVKIFERLIEKSKFVKRIETVQIMKEIVPEFVSNNSEYQVLDANS